MTTETWVIIGLAILSVVGVGWPAISKCFTGLGTPVPLRSPDAFQKRMDLVNELLKECEGCEDETAAVIQAGDVIAEHWREGQKGTPHE